MDYLASGESLTNTAGIISSRGSAPGTICSRLPKLVIKHQVAVILHENDDTAQTRRAGGPQRVAERIIEDEIAVSLHGGVIVGRGVVSDNSCLIYLHKAAKRICVTLALLASGVGDGYGVAGIGVLSIAAAGRSDLICAAQRVIRKAGINGSFTRVKGFRHLAAAPELVIRGCGAAYESCGIVSVNPQHMTKPVKRGYGFGQSDGTRGSGFRDGGGRRIVVIDICELNAGSALWRQRHARVAVHGVILVLGDLVIFICAGQHQAIVKAPCHTASKLRASGGPADNGIRICILVSQGEIEDLLIAAIQLSLNDITCGIVKQMPDHCSAWRRCVRVAGNGCEISVDGQEVIMAGSISDVGNNCA